MPAMTANINPVSVWAGGMALGLQMERHRGGQLLWPREPLEELQETDQIAEGGDGLGRGTQKDLFGTEKRAKKQWHRFVQG
ncbi:MAG: hypothetical protein NTY01_12250 [Verrucomicrobia bacterium]|nr:hypothetical protein [Verrucomicrobiota bacterium]